MSGWSPWDGRDRGRLRRILAVVVALDAAALLVFVLGGEFGELAHPAPRAWARALVGSPLAIAPFALSMLGAGLFWRGRSLGGGVLVLAGGYALSEALAAFQGPGRGVFASGGCVLGWMCGVAYARRFRLPDGDRFAEAGAVGVLAATYVAAAWSKLSLAGLAWARPTNMQAFLLEQAGSDPSSAGARLADAVLAWPSLAVLLAALTLAVEGGAFAMLLGARARAGTCAVILAFHAVVLLGTGILYPGAMILLVTLGFPGPWRGAPSAQAPDGPPDRRRLGAALAVAGALCVLALPWSHAAYNRAHPDSPWHPPGDPPGKRDRSGGGVGHP